MTTSSSPDPSSHISCDSSTTTMSCLQPPPSSGHRSITSRPKLTLQTSSLPLTFGSSTTGLSRPFTATATASPTVRNTFKNAYDVTSPTSATSSPSKTTSLRLNTKTISPYVHNTNPNSPFNYRNPYSLPLGVRSILRNSPLEGASRRRSGSVSAGTSGPGGAGARRIFFPAKKQVSFRHHLEEEIHTERYTAQHLDLVREDEEALALAGAVHEADSGADNTNSQIHSHTAISVTTIDDSSASGSSSSSSSSSSSGFGSGSSSGSDSDSTSLSVSESSTDEGSADETSKTTLSKNERKKRRTLRIERQVRAVALLDGIEADPYSGGTPQTPRQNRVKRRREWKWTLGPIEGSPDTELSQVPQSTLFDQPACIQASVQPESKSQ